MRRLSVVGAVSSPRAKSLRSTTRSRYARARRLVTALDAQFCRSEGILTQAAEGQTVLLRLADGSYYALDEVGARVWELCDGRRSVQEIVAIVSGEFDAPADVISADVLEFVGDLDGERLLVQAP